MLPKPGKDVREVESYRPIALLPIMSKLIEKLILRRLKAVIEKYQLIPTYQFGFRNEHSTIDRVHRIASLTSLKNHWKEKVSVLQSPWTLRKPSIVSGSKICCTN